MAFFSGKERSGMLVSEIQGYSRPVGHDATGVTIPIIPGIMPLQSYASFMRLTTLCGTRIPSRLNDALNPIKVKLFINIMPL
jgi:hypothetical protein